jgi:hypothetical protein
MSVTGNSDVAGSISVKEEISAKESEMYRVMDPTKDALIKTAAGHDITRTKENRLGSFAQFKLPHLTKISQLQSRKSKRTSYGHDNYRIVQYLILRQP